LEYTDFGFVHQILSYERIHCGSISARVKALNGFLIDRLQFVHEYGPRYLESEEMRKRSEEIKDEIYKHLAVNAVHLKGGEFWRYQCRRLQAAGEPVSGIRLARAVCRKLADLLLNPKETVEKLVALRRVEEGSTDTREVGPLPRE
jgi:hypothetical protein